MPRRGVSAICVAGAFIVGRSAADSSEQAEASYLRDIRNYRVIIEYIDAERVDVAFDPLPRTKDEISSGGGGVYHIDRVRASSRK
jgi:hypothetical protein